MTLFDRISATLNSPLEIEVRSASDWTQVPYGFFRIAMTDKPEQLGHQHQVFGARWPVPARFSQGGLTFELKKARELLPLVRLVLHTSLPPGVAFVGGHLIVDTTIFDASDEL